MQLLIKKGTSVLAVSLKNKGKILTEKIIKKDVFYDKSEIAVDPVGKLGAHRETYGNIGGQFARDGLYGFMLPKNKTNYEMILVHQNDVSVF